MSGLGVNSNANSNCTFQDISVNDLSLKIQPFSLNRNKAKRSVKNITKINDDTTDNEDCGFTTTTDKNGDIFVDLSDDKAVSNYNKKRLKNTTESILLIAKELCKNDNLENDYYPNNIFLVENKK
jgi:hypothetical protein